ncbi:hypothetical protein BCD48_30930 [Pseudofrankia sp. BMG5.36]|nr:hypothetical protein BCD48_30930 [Pseudofrankia sp. BMG5.36]
MKVEIQVIAAAGTLAGLHDIPANSSGTARSPPTSAASRSTTAACSVTTTMPPNTAVVGR